MPAGAMVPPPPPQQQQQQQQQQQPARQVGPSASALAAAAAAVHRTTAEGQEQALAARDAQVAAHQAARAAAALEAQKPPEKPPDWTTEMNTVYQGGVDEGREGMDADKIRATKDYGHLYSHFDYLTTGKWLQQTCRQPVSDASGAFVARAVELLLRHTIDNVLEIARVRQNPPKTADFDGTDLEVIESGPNMLERLSSMAKSSAAQARESSSMLDVSSLQGKDNEKWGASNLGEQNKAVSSSIAMLNRKRKQVRTSNTAVTLGEERGERRRTTTRRKI